MNTKEAITVLKNKGYSVEEITENSFLVHYASWSEDKAISARELIKLAKIYTSEGQRTNIKKNWKFYTHRKNRRQTKQDIHKEEFDNFSEKKLRKDDDIWNWD